MEEGQKNCKFGDRTFVISRQKDGERIKELPSLDGLMFLRV